MFPLTAHQLAQLQSHAVEVHFKANRTFSPKSHTSRLSYALNIIHLRSAGAQQGILTPFCFLRGLETSDYLQKPMMVQNEVRTWGFYITLNHSNTNRFLSQPRKIGGVGFSEAWDMCAENFHFGSFLPLRPQANTNVFMILLLYISQQNFAVP